MALKDIDPGKLAKDIIASFSTTLKTKWSDVGPIAKGEAQKLVQTMLTAEELRLKGKLTDEGAQALLDIQRSSTRVALLTVKGLELLAVESAINAALDTVKTTVNTAIGFSLI